MLPGPTRKGSSPQVAARWGSNRPRAQPLAARRRKERPLATNRQGATLAARGAASRGNSVGRKSDVDRRSGYQRARAGAAYAGAATIVLEDNFEMTLPDLLNILREAESTIKKEKSVLYIGETNRKRKASKTIKKGKDKERPVKAKIAKKYQAKDIGQCFYYGQDGDRTPVGLSPNLPRSS
ncbi:hypothetical protein GW17_00026949 [Ensete ventricosum]|nr:hypothetical protein GW17_00026949 [Ensete ventricosum]